jgi:trimethylamine--corrinoid protein Co-methyltransferase
MELAASMMQVFYSRPATIDYLGSLDQGLTYSLHALLLCNDLAGLLRTLWQGVRLDEEMLALDLAREVGPRGNYLAQRHTVNHCREQLWESRYFGPNLPLSTGGRPDKDLAARIDPDLRQLLSQHQPAPLGDGLKEQLRAIRERFAAAYSA